MAGEERAAMIGDTDLVVVIPAFVVSELSTAFQIGFLIFLPFLVIDLVVANVLLAMGMMMMSPVTVSLPFLVNAIEADNCRNPARLI
jgi:type III secretion protein R